MFSTSCQLTDLEQKNVSWHSLNWSQHVRRNRQACTARMQLQTLSTSAFDVQKQHSVAGTESAQLVTCNLMTEYGMIRGFPYEGQAPKIILGVQPEQMVHFWYKIRLSCWGTKHWGKVTKNCGGCGVQPIMHHPLPFSVTTVYRWRKRTDTILPGASQWLKKGLS